VSYSYLSSSRSRFRPRPHVWHQGRKVTPWAGTPMYRWHWRRGPQTRAELQAIDRARRAALPVPPTVGDRTSQVTTVAGATRRHFRLVDKHGKAIGPRLQRTGLHRDSDCFYERWEYQVTDDKGRQSWLDGAARVRLVARQAEDAHSRACRALKAQWRHAIRTEQE
jgi:hypothetical protein